MRDDGEKRYEARIPEWAYECAHGVTFAEGVGEDLAAAILYIRHLLSTGDSWGDDSEEAGSFDDLVWLLALLLTLGEGEYTVDEGRRAAAALSLKTNMFLALTEDPEWRVTDNDR